MPRNRRSKHERAERRHARNKKAKEKAGNAARATAKASLRAIALALVPGAGATAGTYLINKSAKKDELMIEARGIARVAARDLQDAAIALEGYRHREKLPKDFWTPIKASDLQALASNLKAGEWRRFGCAARRDPSRHETYSMSAAFVAV
jgi:hypothetical protein